MIYDGNMSVITTDNRSVAWKTMQFMHMVRKRTESKGTNEHLDVDENVLREMIKGWRAR